MADLTRRNSKVVVSPVLHESHGRVTRQTYVAYLGRRDGSNQHEEQCPHNHGHRTVEAATTCGRAMWKRLPKGAA